MSLERPAQRDAPAALGIVAFPESPLTLSLQAAAVRGAHAFTQSPNPDFSSGGQEPKASQPPCGRLALACHSSLSFPSL